MHLGTWRTCKHHTGIEPTTLIWGRRVDHICSLESTHLWDGLRKTTFPFSRISLEHRLLSPGSWPRGEILTVLFSLQTSINFERRVITLYTWLTFPSDHLKQLNILWIGRKHVNDFSFVWNMAQKTPSGPHSRLELPPHHMHAINQWHLQLSDSMFSVTQH